MTMKSRALVSILSACAASVAVAQAQTTTCTRDGDVRVLEIVTPGVVGKACDLRYTTNNGATVRTPYHANNNAGFCAEKSRTLLDELSRTGYSCVAGVAASAATGAESSGRTATFAEASVTARPAPQPQPQPRAPIETAAEIAPETSAAPLEPGPVDPPIADAAAEEPAIPSAAAIERAPAAEPARIAATAPAEPARRAPEPLAQPAAAPDAGALRDALDEIIPADEVAAAEPARASSGPVTLTSASAVVAEAPAPKKSAAGRLVGAAPLEPEAAAKVVNETAPPTQPAPAQPASVQEAAPSAGENAANQVASPERVARAAPSVIKRLLEAQAAAWNEGDLDAFMAGYWKSPDLRFVSDVTVTQGWTKTLKRYRARYGSGAELGFLSFKNLDVEMITDDVAIVVGRFNLERDQATSGGLFTLVLRRFDGRWRIVHDHTVADAPAASE